MENAIDGAKDDDKIKGIFLYHDFLGGYPAINVANQLEIKLSGKFIISYSDFYSQSAYIISSPLLKLFLTL